MAGRLLIDHMGELIGNGLAGLRSLDLSGPEGDERFGTG